MLFLVLESRDQQLDQMSRPILSRTTPSRKKVKYITTGDMTEDTKPNFTLSGVFFIMCQSIRRRSVMLRLEVYIGSDINGQPDPTKYPTNPNTTRYPNGENRTTRTRPDSELLTRTRPDPKWVTKFPGPQPEFYPKNASIL